VASSQQPRRNRNSNRISALPIGNEGRGIGAALFRFRVRPDFLLKERWPRPLGDWGAWRRSGLTLFLGDRERLCKLPDMKFVKAYPHNPVNFDAIAVLSSASSEGTGVRASTLLVGGGFLALLFCGLVFFAVRLRLILDFFAFRFLAMQYPLDVISPEDGGNIGGVWNSFEVKNPSCVASKITPQSTGPQCLAKA